MQAVYPGFCAQSQMLPTLAAFQFIETHLSRKMLMQQVPYALIDMFNAHHYLPKAICFHVVSSDLGVTLPHLFKFIAAQFCNTACKLISNIQPYKQQHLGFFLSLALSQLWYPGWDSQAAAKQARARLNGALG